MPVFPISAYGSLGAPGSGKAVLVVLLGQGQGLELLVVKLY